MLIYSDLQNVNLHPVSTYFKNEYKSDWEYEYNKFMSSKKSEESFWFKLKNFFSLVFPTEEALFEKRLSECKDLAEVENLIRERDRSSVDNNFLIHRQRNLGLVAKRIFR
jgi:hypothetical protein